MEIPHSGEGGISPEFGFCLPHISNLDPSTLELEALNSRIVSLFQDDRQWNHLDPPLRSWGSSFQRFERRLMGMTDAMAFPEVRESLVS